MAKPYSIERREVHYGARPRFQYRAVVRLELNAGKAEMVTGCWQELRKHALRDARVILSGAPTIVAKRTPVATGAVASALDKFFSSPSGMTTVEFLRALKEEV